jgi:hypothetical protein
LHNATARLVHFDEHHGAKAAHRRLYSRDIGHDESFVSSSAELAQRSLL